MNYDRQIYESHDYLKQHLDKIGISKPVYYALIDEQGETPKEHLERMGELEKLIHMDCD